MSQYLATLSARGREELEEDRKKVKCVCRVCVRARACVRACVRPEGRGSETKRIGTRALARAHARACVRASERARGPEDGMHIRHRKFRNMKILL
jgi:hypothetical protein